MTDTERLDWLAQKNATVYRSGSGGTHWVVVDEVVRTRFGVLGATLREAIDKAMAGESVLTKGLT